MTSGRCDLLPKGGDDPQGQNPTGPQAAFSRAIRLGETASRLVIDRTAGKKHPKRSFLAGLVLQPLTRSLLSSRGPTKRSLLLLRC